MAANHREVFEHQVELGEEITRLKENYKKEPKARLKPERIEFFATHLHKLYKNFLGNHAFLKESEGELCNTSYFVKDYFQQIELVYTSLRSELGLKCHAMNIKYPIDEREVTDLGVDPENDDVKDSVSNEGDSSENDEPNITVKDSQLHTSTPIKNKGIQNSTKELLKKFYNDIELFKSDLKRAEDYLSNNLRARAVVAKPFLMKDFESLMSDIRKLCLTLGGDAECRQKFETIQDQFYAFSEAVDSVPSESVNSTVRGRVNPVKIKLKPIELPIFDGDFTKWPNFFGLFTSLILTNNSIDNVQKLQYLKTHVSDEAAKLIDRVEISGENFEIAWKILNDRFDNKRALCNIHLSSLLNQPKMTFESAEQLRTLHDTSKECLALLKNASVELVILNILTNKLDKETHKTYEQSLVNPKQEQKLDEFFKFIEKRFQVLEAVNNGSKLNANKQEKDNKKQTFYSKSKCVCCNEIHALYKCEKFKKMKVQERRAIVNEKQLCILCLQSNHRYSECFLKRSCSECGRKHNDLLHYNNNENKLQKKDKTPEKKIFTTTAEDVDSVKVESSDDTEEESVNFTYKQSNVNSKLLATALVKIRTSTGWSEPIHVLIDHASTASFVTHNLMQSLQLPFSKRSVNVTGMGGQLLASSMGTVDIEVKPHFPSKDSVKFSAVVINQLKRLVKTKHVGHKFSNIPELKTLQLADPKFYLGSKIEMILGVDIHAEILTENMNIIKPHNTGLVVQMTTLGWIVSGIIAKRDQTDHLCLQLSTVEANNDLQMFWRNDGTNERSETISEEDKYCVKFYKQTVRRNKEGRYIVRLPFKTSNKRRMGNSKRTAMAQLLQLERKFKNNEKFKSLYTEFINEYIRLGHMKKCKTLVSDDKSFYLPHHAVMKESTTTKLRTVFDGSRPTSSGISLNDQLLVGPKLQEDIFNILVRFRTHRIGFIADIEKMYRQIELDETDQNYQRILWINEKTKKVEEFQLTTVTYGTAPAPYLAIQTVIHHTEAYKEKFPEACEKIINDSYVDDVTSGCDDLKTAIKLQREITSILSSAGFPLRKWATNDMNFLKCIPKEHREGAIIENEHDPTVSTLGMYWHCKSDVFEFKFKVKEKLCLTKRSILSEMSRIYDPLGFLSPITVSNKILMQDVWSENVDWEDEVPEDIAKRWKEFRNQIKIISEFRIKRWINYRPNCKIELHGFADASKKAYAAVIYAKTWIGNDVNISIVAAKTRVTSIKGKTLPKLELDAALLLALLMKTVKESLKIKVSSICYYSDSQITLAWIAASPSKWKTYVANRVEKIQTLSEKTKWYYVASKHNPADCASRGQLPLQLQQNSLWWKGPELLYTNNHYSNNDKNEKIEFHTKEEMKTKNIMVLHSDISYDILERFTSLLRASRVIAICKKFITITKSRLLKNHDENGNKNISNMKVNNKITISLDEIEEARRVIIKICQNQHFFKEITALSAKQSITRGVLRSLFPFLDHHGLLRIGGRLQNSQFEYNKIHPIIIPRNCSLANLIVWDSHKKTLHGGNQLTLSQLRHEFWIIGGNGLVKKLINQCIICHRFRSSTITQLMGSLPADRTKICVKPFTNCGTDLCGPIWIKISGERHVRAKKGYIVLFICFSTKAVHIEVVSDLTANAFYAAFKRLIARRGNVRNLYCDNGTNFVGTKNILELESESAIEQFNEDIRNLLLQHSTRFKFNPPAAPWFGGLWERNIGSIKFHLKRVVADRKLTYEELTTVVQQIEACLNSRPLCPLTNNPDDLEALTPSHFLMGHVLTAPIEMDLTKEKEGLLSRWELCKRLRQDFWAKWSNEYLSQLQIRSKWAETKQNLRVDDMVLIRDENTAPLYWPLGRVKKVFMGNDGLVRVVDVLSNGKIYRRPVGKLSLLPIENIVEEFNQKSVNNANDPSELKSEKIENKGNENKDCKKKNINRGTNNMNSNLTNALSLIMMFSLFGLFATIVGQKTHFKITKFQTNPGVIFNQVENVYATNGYWHLISQMNLEKFHTAYKSIDDSVHHLESLCNDFDKTTNGTQCKTLLGSLYEHMADINQKNIIIRGATLSRNKRGVFLKAFLGSALAYLGGSVIDLIKDSSMKAEIENLNEKTMYMNRLLESHTSILSMTENIQESTINEANIVINRTINMFQNETDLFNQNSEIHWMTSQILIAMLEFQKLQDAIIDGNHEGRSGINSMWISFDKMNNQISLISDHISNATILYGKSVEEKLAAIYKLSTTRMLITEENIIFVFEIPLFHSKTFKCYELIPIPLEFNNTFIWVDKIHQFLWLTTDNDSYALATESQMDKCSSFDDNKICKFGMPVRSTNFTSCEFYLYLQNPINVEHCSTKITKPEQRWNYINKKWIFSLPANTTVTVACNNTITVEELSGSGYIDTDDQCRLSTNQVSLSIYDYRSRIDASEFHFGYLSGAWEDQPALERFELIHSNFTEIRAAIKQLNDIKPFYYFNVSNHLVKTIVLITLSIILCITLLVFYFYCTCFKQKKIDHSFILKDLEVIKRNSI